MSKKVLKKTEVLGCVCVRARLCACVDAQCAFVCSPAVFISVGVIDRVVESAEQSD